MQNRPPREATRARRARAAAAVVALFLLTPVAALGLPDVGDEQDGAADLYVGTPAQTLIDFSRAKEADPLGRTPWTHVAGARFAAGRAPEPGYPDGSPTPTEVDFLDVALDGPNRAYAVGSVDVGDGRRVPVIYRYRRDARGDEFWEEVYRSPEDQPGFVARVVLADKDAVLAVGGDGTFPDRERADGSGYCAPGEADPAAQDPAGRGRVWVLREGEPWRELTAAEKPAGVRALTALDSYYEADPASKGSFAVAGGLCQLWHFKDGGFLRAESGDGFAPPYDVTNVSAELPPLEPASPGGLADTYKHTQRRPEFRLRVRDIRFADAPNVPHDKRHLRIAAATSGCCVPGAEQQLVNPLELSYLPPTTADADRERGTWRIAREMATKTVTPSDADPVGLPDSVFALKYTQTGPTLVNTGAPSWYRAHLHSSARERSEPVDRQPPSSWAEPAETETLPNVFQSHTLRSEFPLHALSSLRLVAAAGNADTDRSPLDWGVGALDASGQAAILSTNAEQVPAPTFPLTCESGIGADCLDAGKATQRARDSVRSYRLLKVPLYGLNGVDVDDEEGVGWAVGRYGAIARYGPDPGGAAVEPEPPEIKPAGDAPLPTGDLYDPFRAIATPSGEVPPLAGRPPVQLDRPRLFAAAPLPAQAGKSVMSEDGSEGWAIVGAGTGAQLYRYRDGEWRPCERDAIDTRFAADPSCAALPVERVEHLLRVPATGGEFVAAAMTRGVAKELFFYEDGEWRPGPHAIPASGVFTDNFRAVTFTSPTEAWIHAQVNHDHSIIHYDARREGQEWFNCTEAAPGTATVRKLAGRCGDVEGRLDFRFIWPGGAEAPEATKSIATSQAQATPSLTIQGVTHAGGRPYFYGWRVSREAFRYPWIVFFDGEKWAADPALGGLDPACPRLESRICEEPAEVRAEELGHVSSLALDQSDGLGGWAFGAFGEEPALPEVARRRVEAVAPAPRISAARLVNGAWEPLRDAGPLRDYATPAEFSAFLGGDHAIVGRSERLLRFDTRRERFDLVEAGRRPFAAMGSQPYRNITTVAAARGHAWLGIDTHLFRYTDRPPREVFEEFPHPIREIEVTGAAAAPDGSVWVTTASDRVYRHDPLTGWESARVPGWDPGRLVTVRSRANAIAFGAGGEGVIVGAGGRIARIERRSLRLDGAVGSLCDAENVNPPCGTGRHLRAAAVAPDGSALVGGDARTLLWSPPAGDFRAIPTPNVPGGVSFTSIAMPAADRAWIGTSDGRIFGGTLAGGAWSWRDESRDAEGRRVVIDRTLLPAPVTAVGVWADGTGVAVAERGVIVERSAEGTWQRVETGMPVDLQSLALGEQGAAIAGGAGGLVLTRTSGEWRVARAPTWPVADRTAPDGATVGVALAAAADGDGVEAWAFTRSPALNRVWRYADDEPAAPRPLPDAPARRPGELAIAAWGKTECHNREEFDSYCREMNFTDSYREVIARRIVSALTDATRRGDVDAAVFTGDAVDSATHPGNRVTGQPAAVPLNLLPLNGRQKFARWRELVADRFDDANVPFLVGIGGQDLANTQACAVQCASLSRFVQAGENLVWRAAMDGRLGSGPAAPPSRDYGTLRFRQLAAGELSRRLEDRHVEGMDDPVPAGGGADTHFAVDVEEVATGSRLARLVFADTSLRSLSASDPIQQPLEARGGQALWLERMLCYEPDRAANGEPCTRRRGDPAVVVTNTPTYTYGAGSLATQPDGSSFEELMIRYGVSAVISGRLGWNGLYWTLAPGLHSPCPGGSYPSGPPDAADPCEDGASYGGYSTPAAGPLAGALGGVAPPQEGAPGAPAEPPAPPPGFDESDAIVGQRGPPVPFVVASGGGGKFASEAEADSSAERGFWHGYSVVRVAASANPGETIVEQRPIYDFVTIEAQERRLRPGQRMTLRGWGRGPTGYKEREGSYQARWDRIDTPGITHRYDLLLADPERPHLPLEDANGDYVRVPAVIGRVDRQSGLVRTGRGTAKRTYAVATLSVGEKVATYPLVFEPRRSFGPQRARLTLPPLPRVARAPAAQPPVRLTEGAPPPPPAPPANPGTPFTATTLQAPQPPQLPTLPPAQAPPTPQAPAPPSVAPPPPPPAPPAVPPQPQPQPLALGAKLQAVSIVPSVNPPAPPPVNPAPPAGSAARKEAKQRQAATAKSEEGSSEGAGDSTGDLVQTSQTPNGVEMTRHTPDSAVRRAPDRPQPSFTAVRGPESPSAWARGALYVAGLGVASLAFAAAWRVGRPRPRRRTPSVPAAAVSRVRRY